MLPVLESSISSKTRIFLSQSQTGYVLDVPLKRVDAQIVIGVCRSLSCGKVINHASYANNPIASKSL